MHIYLVCEDHLSEVVMKKMVSYHSRNYDVTFQVIGKMGRGYIKQRINDFNKTTLPFFILIDLDSNDCSPGLINEWLKHPLRDNIVFRVAEREIESWLMADTEGLSKYLNLNHEYIKKEVNHPDQIDNPKEKLISLVNKSRKRDVKSDIVNYSDSSFKQGPAYNTRLSQYVNEYWNIDKAVMKSKSFKKALISLKKIID